MFLRNFVMKSLKSAIGNMPDYWVLNNALGWYDKGVLTESDLKDIQKEIDAQYVAEEAIGTDSEYPAEDGMTDGVIS